MLPREDPGANQPQHSCFSLHNPEKQTKATAAQREFGVGCAGHGQPAVPGMWGQRHHARVDGGDATGEEKQITKSFLSAVFLAMQRRATKLVKRAENECYEK